MNRIILVIIFLVKSLTITFGQFDPQETKLTDTIKFDIDKFNKNQINKSYNFTLNSIISIRQIELDSIYSEEIIQIDSPLFVKKNSYYKGSGNIKFQNTCFYNFPIGMIRYYKEDGTVEKEIDADSLYKFSYLDIIKKIKNEYNVDMLEIEERKEIHRNDKPYPYYTVRFMAKDGKYQSLIICGISGNLLKKINERGEVEVIKEKEDEYPPKH